MSNKGRAAARSSSGKQKAADGDDGKALWEEIQKLGGDKADLELLRGVDDGTAGKSAKAAAAADDSSLHVDLADLVKSLGLATSAPEFAGLVKEKPEKKAKADKKAAKPQPAAEVSSNDAGKMKNKPAKEPKAKVPKGPKAKESKAKAKSTNADD
ncbi:RNA-binding ribosome biosynthesis protein mak21, partial [Coemansia spiralis]